MQIEIKKGKRAVNGEQILKILELIYDGTANLLDHFLVIAFSPYFTSLSGYEYRLRQLHKERTRMEYTAKEKMKFHNLIHRLKKDKLIKKDENNFSLTPKGLQLLKSLKNKILPSIYEYNQNEEDCIKIITFDIPEKYRSKRDWLRRVLTNLEFVMVQKSVWFGKSKLPENLLNDLKKLEMLPYIKIFSINKQGNLEMD